MPPSLASSPRSIKAIIFDMDNTLFDFVAAKQHACREVAKYLDREDWEALFNCFVNSPHGFESHENIRDYFDLCGLLEQCSTGKNTGSCSTPCGSSLRENAGSRRGRDGVPHDTQASSSNDIPDASLRERENVVRIRISQVNRPSEKDSPPGTAVPDEKTGGRRVSVPSACAIPPVKETTLRVPGAQADRDRAGSFPHGEAGSTRPPINTPASSNTQPPRNAPPSPGSQPPLLPVRDNLLADKSLYGNEVFARCCEIYEAEKIRVLEPYPGARETLAELKRRGLPLAVVTDAHNGNALLRLRRTGLFGFFDYVISYDMTGAKKPAPDAFLLALRKLGTKPSETLLVGDSIRRDIAPAKELGMITAYAEYGDRNIRSRDPPDCRPDVVLEDIRDLPSLVQ